MLNPIKKGSLAETRKSRRKVVSHEVGAPGNVPAQIQVVARFCLLDPHFGCLDPHLFVPKCFSFFVTVFLDLLNTRTSTKFYVFAHVSV